MQCSDKRITNRFLLERFISFAKYKVSGPEIYFNSLTCRPGGRDCFSFSAFSLSVILRVWRKREQRTLNLTLSAFFFILTLLASFLLAFRRKSLISLISRGIVKLLL